MSRKRKILRGGFYGNQEKINKSVQKTSLSGMIEPKRKETQAQGGDGMKDKGDRKNSIWVVSQLLYRLWVGLAFGDGCRCSF